MRPNPNQNVHTIHTATHPPITLENLVQVFHPGTLTLFDTEVVENENIQGATIEGQNMDITRAAMDHIVPGENTTNVNALFEAAADRHVNINLPDIANTYGITINIPERRGLGQVVNVLMQTPEVIPITAVENTSFITVLPSIIIHHPLIMFGIGVAGLGLGFFFGQNFSVRNRKRHIKKHI